MGTKEYLLLAMVIVVPLVIATFVTLWTLEQARLRSKKNRRPPRAKSGPGTPPAGPG
jgi:hypothetical protein